MAKLAKKGTAKAPAAPKVTPTCLHAAAAPQPPGPAHTHINLSALTSPDMLGLWLGAVGTHS